MSSSGLNRGSTRKALQKYYRVGRSPQKLLHSVASMVNARTAPLIAALPHPNGPVAQNWGDMLNEPLIEELSGRRVVSKNEVLNLGRRPIYYVVGSSLGGVKDPNAVIWGTGFLSYDQEPRVQPSHIAAVRGPLSRQKYLDAGIDCPETYGDAALLYPRLYQPAVDVQYTLGVIPHFRERHLPAFEALSERDDVLLIDICGGLHEVVDQIASCEAIASSSLHGLIAADAYDVPSVWLRASDLPRGDHFKFHDYLASVGRSQREPVRLTTGVSVDELVDAVEVAPDMVDLDALMGACPFCEGTTG